MSTVIGQTLTAFEVHNSDIYSKDAYMLVYTLRDLPTAAGRKSGCGTNGNEDAIPEPPRRVMEVVDRLNAAHDEACDTYIQK